MSKRVQESNLKEGSAAAKPKAVNLNFSSMRTILSPDVRDPNCQRNHSLDQSGVPACSWKQSAWATDAGRRCVLQRGNKTMLQNFKYQDTGANGRIFSSTRSWKPSAQWRGPSEGGSWNSTIFRSPIKGTWRKSSRT